jgi:hypothetical protein
MSAGGPAFTTYEGIQDLKVVTNILIGITPIRTFGYTVNGTAAMFEKGRNYNIDRALATAVVNEGLAVLTP